MNYQRQTIHQQMSWQESNQQFRLLIQNAGMEPPTMIEPGRLYRFAGVGKKQSNRSGWCRMFPDALGGCFGDWSCDLSEVWQSSQRQEFNRRDNFEFQRRIAKQKDARRKEQRNRQETAAKKAFDIWSKSKPASNAHAYLVSKGITAYGARVSRKSLVLPILDLHGRMTSLQFIKPDGEKKLLSGGRKKGCYIPVASQLDGSAKTIVCEGWATGCTLAEETTDARVIAAIDANNLVEVAIGARHLWPQSELVVAGDDDRQTSGNPGATKARAAAIASGALLALPQWPEEAPPTLSDFNDLASWLRGQSND